MHTLSNWRMPKRRLGFMADLLSMGPDLRLLL